MPPLIVSISGIRGIIGDGLGPREAVRFGLAFGTHLGGGRVVLGRDSRPSGPMLAAALGAGLQATGCRVVDLGLLSTPGTSVMLRHLEADGGAVVTASHNPAPYNGIKLLSRKGFGLGRAEGEAVLDLYRREAFAERGTDGVARARRMTVGPRVHVERVLGTIDAISVRARRFRIVVDAVNGAGAAEMALLLDRLGCECVLIHGKPTGRFGRGPEPVPENLADLCGAVREHGAAAGLALDPDADRLALVDETGRAVGEEYTLALAARHRLRTERGPVACNLSTSRMMDDVAREAGVVLHRTAVGEVNVAEAIEREGCVIGGEGNGGVIDPRVAHVRNSLAGAALVLEMMAVRGRALSELCGELPVYTMVKDKVALAGKRPEAVLEAARRRFADAALDERDGLHFAWPDGWLHVRLSNTEPILRVIAEAVKAERARGLTQEVKALAEG
jgi:phosphomannomutase